MNQPTVVLLGQIGSGKTTLLNKLCNTNEKTAYGGHSVTQYIFCRQSAYANGFRILDTPGFGSDRGRLAHAASIVAALQEGPLNRILVIVKFERLGIMKEALKALLLPISQYKPIVTIIITSWDLSQNPKKDEQEIISDICSFFKINSYILSGLYSQASVLCSQIEKQFNTPQVQVTIPDSVIQTSFELLEDNVKDFDMLADIDKYTLEFQKCVHAVRQFIITYPKENKELDEVMHSLTIYIKQLAQDTINSFEQKNAKKMDQIFGQTGDALQSYLYQIELKKSIQGMLNQVVVEAQQKMRLKPDHPFNFIKQCPHCKIIWVKEEGCNGVTTCGNLPTENVGLGKLTQSLKYIFFYDQKSCSLNVSQQEVLHWGQKTVAQNTNVGQKLKGCGSQINWGVLPPLSQAQLDELIDPGILDFLCDKRGKQNPDNYIKLIYQSQMNIAVAQARLLKK